MRVNLRKENPDAVDYGESGDGGLAENPGGVLAKAATLAVAAYAAKKIGGGLSDLGKGMESSSEDESGT